MGLGNYFLGKFSKSFCIFDKYSFKFFVIKLNLYKDNVTIIKFMAVIDVLILLSTGAPAASAAKPVVGENGVVSVGQDVMVTLVDGGRTVLNDNEMSLVLNVDALSQDLQDFIGGKSARVVAKISCRDRQISTQSMVVFDQAHAAGAGRPKAVAPEFAKPPPGSYGADILETYCAKPAAAPAPTTPTPTMPTPTASSSGPVAAPAAQVQDPPRSGLRNGYSVQLVSSPSPTETDKILARLKSELPFWPSGRRGYVTTAQVRGAAYYRGRLNGFDTYAQAAEFCSKVQAASKPCVVFKESSAHKID
jgi:hypothetical protein